MTLNLLEGTRVLELSLLMPADHVGGMLADLGADVIKVEQPPHGDYVRELGGTLGPGVSEYHLFYNRNKRSLALNLKTEEGQKIFHQLVATADVVYESGTPGSKAKLGADYASCVKANPSIIYASFPPYGNTGPYAFMPSHGWGVFAFANSSPIERMADGRLKVGSYPRGGFTDPGPYTMALAIASAVTRRLRTGQGCQLDLAMCDAVIYSQHSEAFKLLNDYPVLIPHSAPPGRSNPIRFTYYECADGKVIAFQAVEKKFWVNYCNVVGHPEWYDRGTWPNGLDFGTDEPELEQEMIKIFKTKTLAEWIELLGNADIPVTPGYTLPEVLADPHVEARGLVAEYDHPGFGHIRQLGYPVIEEGRKYSTVRPAPRAGEHNEEILTSLGFGREDIEALRAKGVIGQEAIPSSGQ